MLAAADPERTAACFATISGEWEESAGFGGEWNSLAPSNRLRPFGRVIFSALLGDAHPLVVR